MSICKHCRHDYYSHLSFGKLGGCCARPGPSEAMCACEQYEEMVVDPYAACPDGCNHVIGDHNQVCGCQHLTPVTNAEGWLRQHDRCKCRWPMRNLHPPGQSTG